MSDVEHPKRGTGSKKLHASGAAKRKRRLELESEKTKLPKVTSFFQQQRQRASENVMDGPPSITQTDVCENVQPQYIEQSQLHVDNDASIAVADVAQEDVESEVVDYDVSGSDDELDEVLAHVPTKLDADMANFIGSELTSEQKKLIVRLGPCQPSGPFPVDAKSKRCFSEHYYEQVSKCGITVKRDWLCYSPQMNKVYCQPCWLFAVGQSGVNKMSSGYDDWKHLGGTVKLHQESKAHLDACKIHASWQANQNIDDAINCALKTEQTYWRQVLERIVNVTLTLAQGNISFRGHRENDIEVNQGNFLSVITLLAKYDPLLADLLRKPEGTVKYLHHRNHDELIQILSQHVVANIATVIKACPFFSVISDTTSDITKTDQMCQVYRYVTLQTDEKGAPTRIVINESFLGFHAVGDQSSETLAEEIVSCMKSHGLDLSRLRGQGYDGAVNMSGVQARLQKIQPLAIYVHCMAHNLNLALNDSCNNVSEIRNFYDTVEKLYNFFRSVRRWGMLQQVAESNCKTALKRVMTTRWSSRHDALHSLRSSYGSVLMVLTRLVLSSTDKEEKAVAAGLKTYMENFSTVILIVFQCKVHNIINPGSQLLQKDDQ